MTQLDAPVRLCCGQRHWSVACPDGKVMCCLCFERVDITDLSVTEDGQKQDVCRDCAAKEDAKECVRWKRERAMADELEVVAKWTG